MRGTLSEGLGDSPSSQQPLTPKDHRGLAGGHRALGLEETDFEFPLDLLDEGGDRARAVPDLKGHLIPRGGGFGGEPVHLLHAHPHGEEILTRTDDDFTRLRPNLEDENRLREPSPESLPLSHREPRVPIVATDDLAAQGDEVAWRKCRVFGWEAPVQKIAIISCGHETDFLGLGLLGGGEPQRSRSRSHLGFGKGTQGEVQKGEELGGEAP